MWHLTWLRFKKNKLGMIGLGIIIFWVLVAIFAPFIAPYSPVEQHLEDRLKPPCKEYWLGTDEFGRDIFSRIVYGSRIVLVVGIIVALISAAIGVTLGLISGYFGGKVDEIIMRTVDIVWAFPSLILALAIVAILGPGLINAMIAIALVGWASYARVVRAETLSVKEELFIEAARAIGESDLRILFSYILPNVMSSILVLITYNIPSAIITASSLSFLGLGAQPPSPDWGLMLSSARVYVTRAPWYSIFPGLAIMTLVLGFNFVGDGLRDAIQPEKVS
ncbi:dipeptide ABC transporter, dipeptide-binding protein [Pyrococcus sp. NA2]|uniref:nickel transporter permease n=1 Tax=Pyrococcus sp. (strain NA2) TaxID=342949 RepID=UPI000209AD32|nr:nickel transporter permease [Pyrococcus sp. NA2]AEC51590.1 dipeptide ABC transporter, dipeptide-binding protein [Pyrococcus sp. NA2]